MAKEVSSDRRSKFELERGERLSFLDSPNKISKLKNPGRIIIILNGGSYSYSSTVETLPYKNLLVGPFDGDFNIKYEIVDKAEGESGVMRFDDPVRIWKGFKPGDIIKITRPDGSIYYRCVEN